MAFITTQLGLSKPLLHRHASKVRSNVSCCDRNGSAPTPVSKTMSSPFGLAEHAGATGTLAANLFPLPIVGSYGWILNTWRLRQPSDWLRVSVRVHCQSRRLTMAFKKDEEMTDSKCKKIHGIVTGNYAVKSALSELGSTDADCVLTFFDKPRESLTTHVSTSEVFSHHPTTASLWTARGLLYAKRNKRDDGGLEILDVRDT